MNSQVLKTATRYLLPLLLLYSVYLMIEGHHKPGGGFVGGLMAAAAIALSALAYNVKDARRVLWAEPSQLIGCGLLAIAASGIWGMLQGKPFLTGAWVSIPIQGDKSLDLGTPLLFDAGIYLAVTGAALMILLNLAEE